MDERRRAITLDSLGKLPCQTGRTEKDNAQEPYRFRRGLPEIKQLIEYRRGHPIGIIYDDDRHL
jgi:hypothetical protein